MKVLIVYGSKFQSTKKYAKLIQERLEDADIIDAKSAKKLDNINTYDYFILGTNVLMTMFNKHIKKFIQSNIKLLKGKRIIGFVVGADNEKQEQYKSDFSKMIFDSPVFFVGGLFDSTYAKGISKKFINMIIADMKKTNKPFPELNLNLIDEIVSLVR